MKIYLGNQWYDIDEGSVLTENYDETLDSANIRISHLLSEIDIEPYDEVILRDENNRLIDRYMCVDKYIMTQEGLDDPTYSYSISLFSQTKLLEGVALPNISITPRRKGTKLSIYNYLLQYLNEYGPKIVDNGAYVNKWHLGSNVINRFSNVVAPEMQWNRPTLREVFNDLMMVDDCIPILRNNEISFVDLTISQEMSNKSGINYIEKSQNSDDYVSEIRMELQNVMQTSVDDINNVVTTTEFLPFTCENNNLETNNLHLKTQFPILNLNHLWLYIFPWVKKTNTKGQLKALKFDLCNLSINNNDTGGSLIKEKKNFDVLPKFFREKEIDITKYIDETGAPDAELGVANFNIDDYYSQYQNYCLYFERGKNLIEGFDKKINFNLFEETSTFDFIKILSFCSYIKDNLSLKNVPLNNISKNASQFDTTYFTTFFQIEYETTYNCAFSAGKSDTPRNRRIMPDYQTNSWVDAYRQGFLEYQKANRLGNQSRLINQRTESNDMIVIKDKYNDNIVYKTDYQIYKDHIDVNAYATKNYILQDYFTGIKSKVRTWVNAKDEAFERHDLVKYYCELGYTSQENNVIDANNTDFAKYMLSSLDTSQNKPIKYVGITTYTGDNYTPTVPIGYFALNCISRVIGNSLVFSVGFDDNWFVGKNVNKAEMESDRKGEINIGSYDDENTFVTPTITTGRLNTPGGIYLKALQYTDARGEFTRVLYRLSNVLNLTSGNVKSGDVVCEFDVPTQTKSNDKITPLYDAILDLPIVRPQAMEGGIKFRLQKDIHKDNKEIPIISTQFEFRKTDDIYFTQDFVNMQEAIRTIDLSNESIVIKHSNTKLNSVPQNATTISGATLTLTSVNDYCCECTINGDRPSGNGYLYIMRGNKLLIRIKNTNKFYMNVRSLL